MIPVVSHLRQWVSLALLVFAGLGLTACGPAEPVTESVPPDMRRLTEEQYRNIIADVFGTTITVSGRFDPLVRTEGLLAVGAWSTSVSSAGLMQYEEIARSIAAQVLNETNRPLFAPCQISADTAFDEPCARQFLAKVGRVLFRRPLTDEEVSARVSFARRAADSLGHFHDGLSFSLTSLLVDPEFLFITDFTEPDPDQRDATRLTAFSKAARLSFLLWNTTPDDALLIAAENGDLHSRDRLSRQVDRMMASPRLKNGVRAFFSDMLEFNEFDVLEKDSIIYPAFGTAAVRDAREQTLRTITDHLVTRNGDYRDLFTTRKTFMSRPLGMVYQVRVKAPENVWEPFEFPADDPRAGIQAQLSFLALNSHPGRSSPTLRGKAIRNMLLCQRIPDPPADVDFSEFNDPNSPSKTARDRLSAHATNAACAGCHRITDPIGLALENFDGSGQFQAVENGAHIDTSGDLDGILFADGAGLGQALHDNPATTSCLVNRIYAYASGQSLSSRNEWMAYLEEGFAADGYRITALLKRIASSTTFYAVAPADTSGQEFDLAANDASAE
jgi:hypothetical protein